MDRFPALPSLTERSERGDDDDNNNSSSSNSSNNHKKPIPTAEDLGYEDAAPQVQAKHQSEEEEIAAAAAADEKDYGYGYGSVSPTTNKGQAKHYKAHTYDGTRVPRRSSLKQGTTNASDEYPTAASTMAARVKRRASMGCASTTVVEVRIRGERYPVQRRRSIDFDATVEVKVVVPVMEDASCSELWLQPEDFAQMKTERRAVVQKHKTGTAAPDVDESEDIRGLEKYLDRSGRILKNRAWDTVLLEQDEQELTGVFNDQRIADLYKSTTFASPEKAAAMAQQDHEAVRDYLMSPRTTKLMMRRLSC